MLRKRLRLKVRDQNGEVLFVRGTVTSTDGTPLPGAVIDIWQTGPDGGYDIWDKRQPDA